MFPIDIVVDCGGDIFLLCKCVKSFVNLFSLLRVEDEIRPKKLDTCKPRNFGIGLDNKWVKNQADTNAACRCFALH